MATERQAQPIADDERPPWERYDWWLSPEESRASFERAAQELLGISGEEFLRRWDAGEYDEVFDDPDHWQVMHMVFMIPAVREEI